MGYNSREFDWVRCPVGNFIEAAESVYRISRCVIAQGLWFFVAEEFS